MLRLLADENFSGDTLRGLLRRQPDLEIVRVQDVDLSGADDRDVLAWAAENDRIILTQDRAAMPSYALGRVGDGKAMPSRRCRSDYERSFASSSSRASISSRPGTAANCFAHWRM